MKTRPLYYFKDSSIKIELNAILEGTTLTIEGYDIGQRVKELTGDSDYEYTMTIAGEDLQKLYSICDIQGDEDELLEYLAKHFNDNKAFSTLRDFLELNGIKFTSFNWN